MSFHKEPIPKSEQLKSIIRKRVNTENAGASMVESGINTQIVYHNIKNHAKAILNKSQRSDSGSFRNKIVAIKTQSNEKNLRNKKKQLTLQSKNSASKTVGIDKKIVTEGNATDIEMHQKQSSVQIMKNNGKDAILQKLRQRNQILKDQIYKIQKLEDQRTNKSLQKKQYNFQQIYYATSTKQSLLQQLHNAYFKIKQMEAQIQQLRKIQALDQPKKVANLKARIVEVEKVKNQSILKLEKMKRDNKKKQQKIEECRKGGGYAETVRQLIIELDEMRQKHRQLSVFEEKRKQKIVKQQEYIRKLQKQLSENGASSQFIQQMMNKCIYGIEKDKNKVPEKIDNLPVLTKPSGEKMRKQYQKAQHEIGILTKSIKQQQKVLEQVTVQQKNANLIGQRARFQSQQLDQEIQQVSNKISQTRKSIDPSNLKPKPLPPKQPSLQDQKQQQKQHIKQMRKKFYQKKTKKYLQGLQNMDQQQNEFDEKIQSKLQIIDISEEEPKDQDKDKEKLKDDINQSGGNVEDKQGNNQNDVNVLWEGKDVEAFGVYDPTGKIFSDQEVCHNLAEDQCKITGFSVLLLGSNSLIGIKAQYNYKIDTNFHKFGTNSKSAIAEGATIQDDFACVDEEYVTSISGTFSSRNILINITVLTNLNRYHRFGSVLTSRGKGSVQFDICSDGNSRPVYIIGCVNQFGICRFGAKVIRDQSEQSSENEI